MSYAFGLLAIGTLAILAGIKNRTLKEVLQGVTSPQAGGAGEVGFLQPTANEPTLAAMRNGGVAAPSGPVPMGMVTPRKPWNPNGKPMCRWIAEELEKAYRRGARFTVSSGYRSVAEQARVCSETSGPCAEPGKSNHQGRAYPGCAVDIEGAESLAAHLPSNGRLKWTGKSIGDDVHFSSGKQGV